MLYDCLLNIVLVYYANNHFVTYFAVYMFVTYFAVHKTTMNKPNQFKELSQHLLLTSSRTENKYRKSST